MMNDDKKIMEKRKSLLSSEEDKAPLRDRIVRDLYDLVVERKIADKLIEDWNANRSDVEPYLQRLQENLADWDEFVDIPSQGPFDGSSNLHLPVTLWIIKAYHARFMQSIVSPEPLIAVKSRKSAHTDLAADVEEFVKYTLSQWCNHRNGIDEILDQWLWSWLTTGIGFVKWRWDVRFKKFVDVVETVVDGEQKVLTDPINGEEIVYIPKILQEDEVVTVKKTYEGPVCDFLNFEDVAVIGNDMSDIANADTVIHRQYLNASELWTLVERGIFDNDAVEKVIEAGEDQKAGGIGGNIKMDRLISGGESSLDKTYDLAKYEILECYVSVDVDGTGINSDIIVWVHTGTNAVLRVTYLDRMNKSGERPIFSTLFHKRSGTNEHFPVGLVEMLHPLAKEIDAMHNMRVDFGLMSTVPFGFYKTGSSLEPKDLKIGPGVMIGLDNPQSDVYFPQLGNRSSYGFQEEQSLFTIIERFVGVNDLTLGAVSGKQGPMRTAYGSRALQQEASTNMDIYLKRFNRGWKKSLEYLLHMLQQRTPVGFEYRVTGSDGIDKYKKLMNPKEIQGDFDIEIAPSSASSNKQIQMDNATQILQIVQNPLYVQLGVVTPANIYEAIKNYLKTLGVKDISNFIDSKFENQIVLTPGEEIQRIAQGFEVPVLPNGDHEGFISLANSYMQMLAEHNAKANENVILLIVAQIKKHEQMAAAMKQMQAQQANMNQAITNQNMTLPTPSMSSNGE